MGIHDDESFGVQYSQDSLYDICLSVAQDLQAFYLGGSTSKNPNGLTLEEYVKKAIEQRT